MLAPHIAPAALGTGEFGSFISANQSCALLDTFAELGGRIIDTANCYAFWHPNNLSGASEAVIGSWLKNRNRDDFVITSKVGAWPISITPEAMTFEGLGRKAIFHAVKHSLKRLDTSHLDILLAHHDYPQASLLEFWSTFCELVESGKVAQIGVSNFSLPRLEQLLETIYKHNLLPCTVFQYKYSLLQPAPDFDTGNLEILTDELKNYISTHAPEATIFGYSPLLDGAFEKHSTKPLPPGYDTAENRATIEQVQMQAEAKACSPSGFVLQAIARQGIVPISVSRDTLRLRENFWFLAAT